MTVCQIAGAWLLGWGLVLASPAAVTSSPDLDPGRYTGEWSVTPALTLSCTLDYRGMRMNGEFGLRRLTTTLNQTDRLAITAHMDVEVFGVSVPGTRTGTMVLPLDQRAQSVGGGGPFSTDTAEVSIPMMGEILITTSGWMRVSADFSGPDTFTADIILRLKPRVRVSDAWRTAECTEIDGRHTATRIR